MLKAPEISTAASAMIQPFSVDTSFYSVLRRLMSAKKNAVKTGRITKMSSRSRLVADKDPIKLSPVCTNCREKHLKCSGAPLCSRCKNEGSECTFVPSRRGMRPSKRRSPAPQSQLSSSNPAPSSSQWTPIQPATSQPLSPWTGLTTSLMVQPPAHISPSQGPTSSRPDPGGMLSVEGHRMIQPQPVAGDSLSMTLINNTYQHFLPLHPFALPKDILVESLNRPEVQYLRAVIEYVGSFYVQTINQATYANYAERLFFSNQYPQNAYTVQAFLLLAIKLAADGEHAKSIQVLQRSRDCAEQIGMNRYDFAQLHSGGSALQEASWQATWVALNQLCDAWSLPTATTVPEFFNLGPLSLPNRPAVVPPAQPLHHEIGRRRSSSGLHFQHQPQPQRRSWDLSSGLPMNTSPMVHSMTSTIGRSEVEFFNAIAAYDHGQLSNIPASGWILESQQEEQPKQSKNHLEK